MSCSCPSLGFTPPFLPNVSNTLCERYVSTSTSTPPPAILAQSIPSTSGRWGTMGILVHEDITNLPKPITLSSDTSNSGVTTRSGQNLKKCCFYRHAGSPLPGYSSNVLELKVGGPGEGFNQSTNPPNFYGPPIERGALDTVTAAATCGCLTCCNNNQAKTWGNQFGWQNSTNCGPNCRAGRLAKVGVWNTLLDINEWYGFVSCIQIPTTQVVYIGMAADDNYRFFLNGNLLVESIAPPSTGFPWYGLQGLDAYGFVGNSGPVGPPNIVNWNVFPITLSAGTHIFSLEGYNIDFDGGLAAEIYTGVTDVQDFRTMTIQAGPNQLSQYIAFSTLDRIGTPFQSGQVTCPNGYFLNNCGGTLICTQYQTISCAPPAPSPTSTSTPTPTPTKTSTPTPTPTSTPGISPTPTSTVTPTVTPTSTVTPTVTPTKTPTPTPTPNYKYLQFGYVQANECDVITIYPMEVTCLTTPTSTGAGNSNGIIELLVSGGTLPYTITMTDSNGQSSLVGQVIYNLPVGTYSFVVVDYFGDFTATTTCTVSSIPVSSTPTPTPTSTPPSCFCLSFNIWPCTVNRTASSIPIVRTFCQTSDINGSPAWISNTGQEVIYYGLVSTNGSANLNPTYQISGSTLSPLMGPDFVVNGQPCNTIINRAALPNSRVFDNITNGTYWSLINTINNRTSVFNITKGNC